MNFKIVKKSFVFFLIFFAFARMAHASIEITEIMYDTDGSDENKEWVEIYNNGDSSVDVSSWSIADFDTSWHYHGITPYTTSSLGSNEYAVLVRTSQSDFKDFKLKWPSYSEMLFRGSFDLGNTSSKLALSSDKQSTIGEVSYSSSQGASGDGNSLQKIDGNWVTAAPTLGSSNKASSNSNTTSVSASTSSSISSSGSSSSSASTSKKESEIPKITTEIITKNPVVANIAFPIESVILGYSKEVLTRGKFVWNFGDGVIREDTESHPFTYVYQYPGEYVLSMSYYQNPYSTNKPDTIERMIIKVIPSEIYISSVGSDNDAFVELENKSTYELDLSKWILKGSNHAFVLPNGTVILPNKKLKLSPRTTLFNNEDIESISLQNPSGETFASYPVVINPPVVTTSTVKTISNFQNNKITSKENTPAKESSQAIDLNNLGASTSDSNVKISNSMYAWFGLVFIIIIGIISTLLINHKKVEPSDIEKEVSAQDFSILE